MKGWVGDCLDIFYFNNPTQTLFIIRPKQCIALGEYWNYQLGPKNGLHAASYNSTESEPIWRKFGKLWAKCWGLATADLGRDPLSSDSLRGIRIFFVRQITHNFTDFPFDNFQEFCPKQRWSMLRCKLSEQNFEKFYHKGSFFQKKSKNFSKIVHFWRLQAARTPLW